MISFRTKGAAALLLRPAAVVAALAAACSMGAADAAPPAPAAGRTLVVLGDSFAANPSCDGVLVKCDGGDNAAAQGCSHRDTSWPVQLSELMGVAGTSDFENRSCTNASIDSGPVTSTGQRLPGRDGYTLTQLAREAADNGAFGPRTRVVAIQVGANDAWPRDSATTADAPAQLVCAFNIRQGCDTDAVAEGRWPNLDTITGAAYADRIRNVVDYVKYYAPNAKIELVGYPELAPANSTEWCLDVLGGIRYVQPRAGAIDEFWNRLDAAEREAAQLLSIDFVDARAATAGHGLCSADPWLLGILDPEVNLVGLPFHPSPRGDAAVAAAVHSRVAQTR